MNQSQTEQHLIQAVRQHDADALAQLLELYQPRLRAFVTQNMSAALQQKVDADDILQEVGMSCVQSLPEINFAEHEPFSWICHVAKRRIMDAGRRYGGSQKRDMRREVGMHGGGGSEGEGRGLVDLLVASITSPSKAFSRDQRQFHLWNAFEQLPEDSRRALHLRYVDGLPSKEIAEAMNKSDGAVRVLLTRSLKKLEAILSESPRTDSP